MLATGVDRYLAELLDPANTSLRLRGEMEQDPSFKQLIPYCIFRHRDAEGRETVFQYTRGKGQGESRLHSKRSVGIGGHISAEDVGDGLDNPYREGLKRELEEEVFIDSPYRERCVGLLNDDLTEVGKVHLGVVHLYDLETPDIRRTSRPGRMRLSPGRRAARRSLAVRNLVADLPGNAVRRRSL